MHLLDTLNLGQPGCLSPDPSDPIYIDNPPLGNGSNRGEFFGGKQCGPLENRTLTNFNPFTGGYNDNQSNFYPGGTNRKLIFPPKYTYQSITYDFRSITGCDSVTDEYDTSWNVGTDGDVETCIISDTPTSADRIIRLEYKITVISIGTTNNFVGGNQGILLDQSVVGTPGYPSANPNDYPLSTNPGPNGLIVNATNFNGSVTRNTAGLSNVRLIAPLIPFDRTGNPGYHHYDRTGFSSWTGCTATEDRYDQNWQLTTAFGGTATGDGIAETCYLNFPNDETPRTIRANYRQIRINVLSNIPNVTTLNTEMVGRPTYTTANPDFYVGRYFVSGVNTGVGVGAYRTGGNIGSFPGFYDYQAFIPGGYNIPGGTNLRLIAPLKVATSPAFTFNNWNNCALTEDRYDATWNLTTTFGGAATGDGIAETCVLALPNSGPLSDPGNPARNPTMNFVAVTRITVGSNMFDNASIPVPNKYLDLSALTLPNNGRPELYASNALGTLGGEQLNTGTYERAIAGNPTGRIVAQMNSKTPYFFGSRAAYFLRWNGCTTTEDRFDAAGNLTTLFGGTATPDGLEETCYFNFTDNNANYPLNAQYAYTLLNIQSNRAGTKILDYSVFGDPAHPSPDPNFYVVNNLGPFGWSANYDVTSFGLNNRRFVAPIKSTTDSRFVFDSWSGCSAVEDNWSVDLSSSVFGSWNSGTDGISETCVMNYSNDGVTRTITANYKTTSIIVRTNKTGNKFLDQAAIVGSANPNTYTAANLGVWGDVANSYWNASFSYYQVNLVDTGQPTINTRIIAPLDSTTDAAFGFIQWTGCNSVEDNWTVNPVTGVWTSGPDSVYETCVLSFPNDNQPHEVQADYAPTRVRVVSNTFSTQFLDRTLVGTPGYPSANPNSYNFATNPPGQFGGKTVVPFATTKYSYIKYTNLPAGGVIAPLTDTVNGYTFAGWINCPNPQDNYTGSWAAGTDGVAETCVFNFPANGATYTIEALYTLPVSTSSIGDLVFLDYNGDGVYNGADSGVSGVEVSLWNDTNTNGILDGLESLTLQTQLTTSTGSYSFGTLQPGQYIVRITDSGNILSSLTLTLGLPNTNNNSQGSGDKLVTIPNLSTVINYMDFGYTATGIIGNQVFVDANTNAQFDLGESGIGGVIINLYIDTDANNNYTPGIDTFVTTQTTLPNGTYSFTGLTLATTYIVTVDTTTPSLAGLNSTHTTLSATNPADNYARNPGSYASTLTLVQPVDTRADFGYVAITPTAVIGDLIFFDYNGNGVRDPEDDPLANVEITLWNDTNANGALDGAETSTAVTTTTNSSGLYQFGNLPVGAYLIRVTDSGNVLAGLMATLGAPTTNNNSQGGGTLPLVISSNGEIVAFADFGYTTRGSINGQIFNDSNTNGFADSGENGLDQVEVRLYRDSNANGIFDSGVDFFEASITTSANGAFSFTNLILKRDYIVIPNPLSTGLVGKVSTATNTSNSLLLPGYAKFSTGVVSALTRSIITTDYSFFGYQTPPPAILQAPTGLTSVRRISADEVEWQLEIQNRSNTQVTTVQALSPVPTNTNYSENSLMCTTSQSSVIQACEYNPATRIITVQAQLSQYTGPLSQAPQPSMFETPVYADATNNSVFITFRTKLNTVFREFIYQARMYWDENNDAVINTQDTSFAAQTPRLSDDPTLPGQFDPTVYRLSSIPILVQTGISYLWVVILAAALMTAALTTDYAKYWLEKFNFLKRSTGRKI